MRISLLSVATKPLRLEAGSLVYSWEAYRMAGRIKDLYMVMFVFGRQLTCSRRRPVNLCRLPPQGLFFVLVQGFVCLVTVCGSG